MWFHMGVVIHNTQNIYIPDVKATNRYRTRDITYYKILILSILEILRFERYVL